MGQILQEGEKVLEMSQLHPHSKSRSDETVGLGNFPFGFLENYIMQVSTL